MGVTAAVIGAVAAVGGTTAAVEGQAQQRRAAGQAAVGQRQMLKDAATKDQIEKDKAMQESATAAMKDTNMKKAALDGSTSNLKGGTLLTGYGNPAPSNFSGPVSGGRTLLGS